jgi:hypothetical protein
MAKLLRLEISPIENKDIPLLGVGHLRTMVIPNALPIEYFPTIGI